MKTNSKFILSLISLTFLFSGCAMQELEDRVAKLERNLQDIRKYQAEQDESITSIDSQTKNLSGRIEELEFGQNKKVGSELSRLGEDVSSIRRRLPPPSVIPIDALEVDEVWAKSLTGEPGELVSEAFLMLREAKFADAAPLFENAVSQLDGTDKASVPLFWLGITQEGLGSDKEALRAYVELSSRYPKSQRASTAYLRQAEVLMRLGDRKAAELALKKLIADYPKSGDADRAKLRLKDLRY